MVHYYYNFFDVVPLMRRHLYQPPSMVYISVIITLLHSNYKVQNQYCGDTGLPLPVPEDP